MPPRTIHPHRAPTPIQAHGLRPAGPASPINHHLRSIPSDPPAPPKSARNSIYSPLYSHLSHLFALVSIRFRTEIAPRKNVTRRTANIYQTPIPAQFISRQNTAQNLPLETGNWPLETDVSAIFTTARKTAQVVGGTRRNKEEKRETIARGGGNDPKNS